MDPRDYDLIIRLRAGEKESNWNEVEVAGDRSSGSLEARFNYYDGVNPDWPQKRLQAEYQYVLGLYEFMRQDPRNTAQIIPNPVVTKGLTQVTMGSPQPIYNGGLLRATVRYFDRDRACPGLPQDVAALVDKLESNRVRIQLVNLNRTETRNVIVQAGAFGEHRFTQVRFQTTDQDGSSVKAAPVDSRYFAVELPPSTRVQLEGEMQRFVNQPSYAFPGHGGKGPIPFQ